MKKLVALLVSMAFVAGAPGVSLAQAPADKKIEDKKMTGKPAASKMATKTASGTVKSASADSLVVAGKDKGKDTEWTFGVDPKTTKVRKAGKPVAAADLAPGDPVSVRYAEHDGKAMATAVTVKPPATKRAESKPAEKK